MSDYSSFGGGNYGATQERGRVMEQVRSQIAVANLQEMIIVRTRVCTAGTCVRSACMDFCWQRYFASLKRWLIALCGWNPCIPHVPYT